MNYLLKKIHFDKNVQQFYSVYDVKANKIILKTY